MKVLAVIGSPKGKGNTYNLVKKLEEEICAIDSSVEFEYLLLKDAGLQPCRGCFQCLEKGEHLCPLKDSREDIEGKMQEADGVIFASPVYVYNVSALMKGFIDRLAYICHRPCFNGKRAVVASTTGGVGLKFTLFTLAFEVGTWGFKVVHKLGAICPPGRVSDGNKQKLMKKDQRNIGKTARVFYNSLKETEPPKPGLIDLIAFNLRRTAFSRAEKDLADYRYWKSMGWLEEGAKYFYTVRVNAAKRLLAAFMVKLMYLVLP